MTKRLSRAELKMHRDVANKIKFDATENRRLFPWLEYSPIFIPKRKKKK